MRAHALVAAVLVVAACSALPSTVPLSDTGGALVTPGANDRDRRSISLSDESAGGAGSTEEIEVVADSKSPPSPAVADAGVVDAGQLPKSETSVSGWPGEYYGSDRFVRRFRSKPDEVQLDDKAHTRVEEPSPNSLVISVVNSATGDVICALKAGAQGSEATLESGQSCFADEDLEAKVTSGRAKLAGDLLTLDFEGEIEAEDDDADGAKDSYHFEGRRR